MRSEQSCSWIGGSLGLEHKLLTCSVKHRVEVGGASGDSSLEQFAWSGFHRAAEPGSLSQDLQATSSMGVSQESLKAPAQIGLLRASRFSAAEPRAKL